MKNWLSFIFYFLTAIIYAQKDEHALIVYLEDAETGKNIKDARVALEGFEIPAISGKYDEKGKYYYFDAVPQSYNTVMIYHEKYNEEGYQSIKSLPAKISLKLKDKRFMSYDFERPTLKVIKNDYAGSSSYYRKLKRLLKENDSVVNKNYRYLYNEDEYHIAVITNLNSKDFFKNEEISTVINKLSLEQTLYSYGVPETILKKCYCFDYMNKFSEYQVVGDVSECDTKLGYENKLNVYFFHKKDKSKFKRFNCPEIKALRDLNLTVAALTYRVLEYFADLPFSSSSFLSLYNRNIKDGLVQGSIENYDFNRFKEPVQTIYSNAAKEEKMYFGSSRDRIYYGRDDSDNSALYFIISKSNSSSGLGALDNGTGYYFNTNK